MTHRAAARSAAPAPAAGPPPTVIDVRIERIVVTRLSAREGEAFGDALRAELGRVLGAAAGRPDGVPASVSIDRIDAGEVRVGHGSAAETVSGAVARAIHGRPER